MLIKIIGAVTYAYFLIYIYIYIFFFSLNTSILDAFDEIDICSNFGMNEEKIIIFLQSFLLCYGENILLFFFFFEHILRNIIFCTIFLGRIYIVCQFIFTLFELIDKKVFLFKN